jgi:hypothetical protein
MLAFRCTALPSERSNTGDTVATVYFSLMVPKTQ